MQFHRGFEMLDHHRLDEPEVVSRLLLHIPYGVYLKPGIKPPSGWGQRRYRRD